VENLHYSVPGVINWILLTRIALAGIGFAKDKGQNLLLLKRMGDLRRALRGVMTTYHRRHSF
jgi:hypothetical protein